MAGRFNEHHALLCQAMLARIDQADATVKVLGARIEELLGPYEAAVTLWSLPSGDHCRVAGVLRIARVLLGADQQDAVAGLPDGLEEGLHRRAGGGDDGLALVPAQGQGA